MSQSYFKQPEKPPYVGVTARHDGKPMEVGGVTVRILAPAFDRMQAYINECPHEVSGKARVVNKGDHFLITDVVILHQEAGHVHTTIEGADDARFVEEVVIPRGEDPSASWNCWWHSHVTMSAYFSSHEDVPTIYKMKQQLPDLLWQISIVGNKQGDFRARFDVYEPHRIVVDNIMLEIVFGQSEALAVEIRKELKDHIRPASTSFGNLRVVGPGKKYKKKDQGTLGRLLDKFTGGGGEVELEEEGDAEDEPTTDSAVPTLEQFNKAPYSAKAKIIVVWQSLLTRMARTNGLTTNAIICAMSQPQQRFVLENIVEHNGVALVEDALMLWDAIEAATALVVAKKDAPVSLASGEASPVPTATGNGETPAATSVDAPVVPAESTAPRRHLYEMTRKEYNALTTEPERDAVIESWLGRLDEIVNIEGVNENVIFKALDDTVYQCLFIIKERWSKPGPHIVFEGDGATAFKAFSVANALLQQKVQKDSVDALIAETETGKTIAEKDALLDAWCDEIRSINETMGLDPDALMALLGLNPRDMGAVTTQLVKGVKAGRQIKGMTAHLAATYLAYLRKVYAEAARAAVATEGNLPATPVADAPAVSVADPAAPEQNTPEQK